jgi:hypothetical protein
MTAERTAEEWGRVAVSLPGWRVLRGMKWHGEEGLPMSSDWLPWPDPDDPATAGCLLALLGPAISMTQRPDGTWWVGERWLSKRWWGEGPTLGRACIAAAGALGRWPNLAESGQKGAE